MAFTYIGAGGAFTGGGSLAAGQKALRTTQGTLETRRATISSTVADASMHVMAPAFAALDAAILSIPPASAEMAKSAAYLFAKLVNAEDPVERYDFDTDEGLEAMARQLNKLLRADAYYITGYTASGTVTADAANTGTGTVIVGFTNPDGENWAMSRPEDITLECVQDSQGGGALVLPGREMFTLRGQDAPPFGELSKDWANAAVYGSGMRADIRSTCGTEDQKSGPGHNILRNSDLEDWTSNLPDYWEDPNGLAGVELLREAAAAMRGTYGGKFVGDGAKQLSIKQNLNGTDGLKLEPRTTYGICVWLKDGAVAPSAGTIRLSIQDGAGNVIGNASTTLAATSLSASWQALKLQVYTPAAIPAGAEIVFDTTVAVQATGEIYFDEITCQKMYHPHAGGPYFGVVAGSANFVRRGGATKGDRFNVAVANNWVDDSWMKELCRLFRDIWYRKGIIPPVAGTTLINNNLIV